MAGITLATAEARLAEYMDAESKVLANQSYTIEGRTMTRADLAAIRDGIKYWENQVERKQRSGRRIRLITPSTN